MKLSVRSQAQHKLMMSSDLSSVSHKEKFVLHGYMPAVGAGVGVGGDFFLPGLLNYTVYSGGGKLKVCGLTVCTCVIFFLSQICIRNGASQLAYDMQSFLI